MDPKPIVDKLLKLARSAGASACEVYLRQSDSLSLTVRNGQLERIARATTGGVGLRLLAGQRLAFVSSSDLADSALADIVRRGVALAREAEPDSALALPKIEPEVPDRKILDPRISDVKLERKIEILREAEAAGLAVDPRVKNSEGAWWHDSLDEVVIASTQGGPVRYASSLFAFGVELGAEQDGVRQTGEAGCPRRFFVELREPAEIGREAAADALALLGGKPVKSARVPVVFDRHGTAQAILRWGLGQAVIGDHVRVGRSFLQGKLNQKVASPLVSVVDDGRKPQGLGSAPFDGEGVRTQRNLIVVDGELKMYVYDTVSGRRSGAASTGSAARGSYAELPGAGFTNLYLTPGAQTRQQLIAGVQDGFYCLRTLGFGIDAATGNYSVAALGRWIRNGELAEPVAGITLAGRLADMLLGIDAVADDLTFENTGWGEGAADSPSFRVTEMTIAGT